MNSSAHTQQERLKELLISVSLTRMEIIAPRESKRETWRLVKVLAEMPFGVSRRELLCKFYPDYPYASQVRRKCLEASLNKIITRSRPRTAPYGFAVRYQRSKRVWKLALVHWPD